MVFKKIKQFFCKGKTNKKTLDYTQLLNDLVVETHGGVSAVKAPWKSKLPGFVYGAFRNLGDWQFTINKKVKRVRLRLVLDKPEVFHFNHIRFWKKAGDGTLEQITSGYICRMSSVAEVLPDPALVMTGGFGNTVSAHSKRESNPWWEVEFDEPQYVVLCEFLNRKDSMGKRAMSLMLTAYDAENTQLLKWGRPNKDVRDTLFVSEIIPTLQNIHQTLVAHGHKDLAEGITGDFCKLLLEEDKESIAGLKSRCRDHLSKAFVTLRSVTCDISFDKEAPTQVLLNGISGKYLRVLAYGQPKPTSPILNVKLHGKNHALTMDENHKTTAEFLEKKSQSWCLPPLHIFSLQDDGLMAVDHIDLSAGAMECADNFVLREVQISNDGENWITVETTLPAMTVQMQALTLYEWIVGEDWDEAFVAAAGYFYATYRMHRARAFKPLIAKRKNLPRKEGLKAFMAGIEDGGSTAKYLPNVIFTRHGLSVPFSEKNAEHLCERMHAFAQFIEDSFGLKVFPCYGTLLGIYRDGTFLPHDDDIDMACVVDLPDGKTPREATEDWCERIKALGVDCQPPTPTSLNLHVYFEGEDMDLFFTYRQKPQDKNLLGHMVSYKVMDIKTSLIEPISTLEFMGRTFYAPAKVEAFLEARYGKTWNIPDPTYEL